MRIRKSTINLLLSLTYKVGTCIIGLLIPRLFVMSYGSELNGLQSSVTQIFSYIGLIEAGVGEATLQALFGPISRKDYKSANSILAATTVYYNKIGLVYLVLLFILSLIYPLVVTVESVSFLTVCLYILFSGLTTAINFFISRNCCL